MCPRTHEQNGVKERKIRDIVDNGLAALSHASLPLKFWNFSFETVLFAINRFSALALQNMSPFQKLFHTLPRYDFMRVLGCAVFPC